MLRVPGVFVVQPCDGPIRLRLPHRQGIRRPSRIAREIDGDKPESRAAHAFEQLLPQFFVGEAADLRRGHLDAGKIAMESHPILAETEPGHDPLGRRHPLETDDGDRACRWENAMRDRRARASTRWAARDGGECSRIAALSKPSSTKGERTPASSAARLPGRWSDRSSVLSPLTMTARSRSAATRRADAVELGLAVVAAVAVVGEIRGRRGLRSKIRAGARYRSRSASSFDSSSSAGASEAETAVKATARSPSASWAAFASRVLSTPPE